MATGCSGIRTATVPRVSPRSHCSEGCLPARRGSAAPGQNASTSVARACGHADGQPVERARRRRPAPAAACRARGPWRRAARRRRRRRRRRRPRRRRCRWAARRARPRWTASAACSSPRVALVGVVGSRSGGSRRRPSVGSSRTPACGHERGRGRPGRGGRRRRPSRPARRAGRRRRALHVGVLDDDQPAGAQQPGAPPARRTAHARRARPSPAPQRQRAGRGRAPRGRGSTPSGGMYGGLHTTTSTVPSRSAKRLGRVARGAGRRRCPARLRARPRAGRRRRQLDRVHLRRRAPRSRRASAIAPDPVHRSTTTGVRPCAATPAAALDAPSRRPPRSPAAARRPRDRPRARRGGTRAVPVRCCSGTRAARRATSAS